MQIHELRSYTIIEKPHSSSCVAHFEHSMMRNCNRVTTFAHYLVPVSLQMASITLLIIRVARSRARTRESSVAVEPFLRKRFISSKELYITPMAVALSALPQITVCFSLACQPLNQ